MIDYLFATDDSGKEIPGTRRSLDHVTEPKEHWAVRNALRQQLGEGCEIRCSWEGELVPW